MTAPLFSLAIVENAAPISCGVCACAGAIVTPTFCAADWMSFSTAEWPGFVGFSSTATRESLGTMLSSISRSLGLMSPAEVREPGDVAFGPCQAFDETGADRVDAGGAHDDGNRGGGFLRRAGGLRPYRPDDVHFQVLPNSAASSGSRSTLPSAKRHSITRFLPST